MPDKNHYNQRKHVEDANCFRASVKLHASLFSTPVKTMRDGEEMGLLTKAEQNIMIMTAALRLHEASVLEIKLLQMSDVQDIVVITRRVKFAGRDALLMC